MSSANFNILINAMLRYVILRHRQSVMLVENCDCTHCNSWIVTDEKDMNSSSDPEVAMVTKQENLFKKDHDKSALHGTGILFKENAISRAYEQLSYTSCIKK